MARSFASVATSGRVRYFAPMPRHSRFALDAATPFVALDFETADRRGDSACAVALMRVEGLEIVERRVCLIRPPRRYFQFTYIHGITWDDVKFEPTFAESWPHLRDIFDGAEFVAAHNAGFDRHVLHTCCTAARLDMPPQPFLCTVQLSRRTWRLPSNNLPAVCRHLGIELNHHDAESDAEACAHIVIAAARAKAERVKPQKRQENSLF
jgi:DNA polymerase III subunit epsilon